MKSCFDFVIVAAGYCILVLDIFFQGKQFFAAQQKRFLVIVLQLAVFVVVVGGLDGS